MRPEGDHTYEFLLLLDVHCLNAYVCHSEFFTCVSETNFKLILMNTTFWASNIFIRSINSSLFKSSYNESCWMIILTTQAWTYCKSTSIIRSSNFPFQPMIAEFKCPIKRRIKLLLLVVETDWKKNTFSMSQHVLLMSVWRLKLRKVTSIYCAWETTQLNSLLWQTIVLTTDPINSLCKILWFAFNIELTTTIMKNIRYTVFLTKTKAVFLCIYLLYYHVLILRKFQIKCGLRKLSSVSVITDSFTESMEQRLFSKFQRPTIHVVGTFWVVLSWKFKNFVFAFDDHSLGGDCLLSAKNYNINVRKRMNFTFS